jgi:lysophospholipase L1-like esterase
MGKYRSLGTLFNRVFRNDLNANFDNVDADIKTQKTRVDNLIVGTPQPSEVVDARGGAVVLSDRLDGVDSSLAENAILKKGKKFPTNTLIKIRLGQISKGVCIGDSITYGTLDGTNEVSYPLQLQEQVSDAYYNFNLTILNKGVQGERSDQILARFQMDVINNTPDFVIIMCGTNDLLQQTSMGVFETNLSSMVEMALGNNIEVILATILPIYGNLTMYVDYYNNIIKKVAERYEVCLVDINKDVSKTISKQMIAPLDFLGDGVHPKWYLEYKVLADIFIKDVFYPPTDLASETVILPSVKSKSCITDVSLIVDDATEMLKRHLTMRANGGVITGTTIKFYVYNDCKKGTQFYILGNKTPNGGKVPYSINKNLKTELDFYNATTIKDYEFLIGLDRGWNFIELRSENGSVGMGGGYDLEISGFGVK